jgi:hypothetical protein
MQAYKDSIICRLCGEKTGTTMLIGMWLESLVWILILLDCVYIAANSPPKRSMLRVAAFGGIFVLICFHVFKRACTLITKRNSVWKK